MRFFAQRGMVVRVAAVGLLLDTGSLIESENRQSELKFETLLYGLTRLKYDAVGLTPGELKLKDKLALASDDLPEVEILPPRVLFVSRRHHRYWFVRGTGDP